MFPCDVGHHRYAGAQQTMYPAIATQSDVIRRKLRLCPDHFDDCLTQLQERAQRAQLDFGEAVHATCYFCGGEVTEDATQFFVTVYAKGEDRDDYWSVLHSRCARDTAREWSLESLMPV